MSDGVYGEFPSLIWIYILIGIVMIGVIGLVVYSELKELQTVYKMPNGILCETKLMKGSGVLSSGYTFEFRQCKDGKNYINPEHYKEIRK